MIICAHGDDALGVEEHVLGAAQADALGAELARRLGIERRLGIGAHLQPPHLVGPAHQRREVARQLRLDHGDGADEDLAGAAVDGQDLAAAHLHAARGQHLVVVVDATRRRSRPRRAGPCRARRPRRGWSCRRAWSGCPCAACMPWMSSGLVSMRTRMTDSPFCARASASSALNTTMPDAAPGEAGRPLASTLRVALGSSVGCSSWSSAAGFTRLHRLGRGRSALRCAMSTAILRRPPRCASRCASAACTACSLHGELDVLHVG